MLLSEVLNLAKKLHALNESFKSKTIKNILKSLDNTTFNLNVEYINAKNKYWNPSALTEWDIIDKYRTLYNNNELTQDLLDNHDERVKLFNIKYVKKSNKDFVILNNLLDSVYFKTENHIGISEITENNLVSITPEEAKKKPYKSSIQFWIDYNGNLKAICKDNKIICLIVDDGFWYESNPDYSGPTDMELFKIFASKSYYVDFKEIRENFIDKAFNKIQAIKVLFHSDDIKYELGANNIKTLQNKGGIYKVYAANIQGQEESDYNEIYKQRQDYKIYLESQRNLVEKNKERREKQKQIRKEQGIDNNVLLTLDDAYDVLFNTYTDLQSFTMRYISDNKVHKLISNYQIDITNNYDFYKLQEINPVNMRTYNYGTRRYKDIRYYYYINNIGDAFIVLNYYLELFEDIYSI